jgi:hypothetical protein
MGVKLNLKEFLAAHAPVCQPGLKVRVIGTAIWSSAVLLSQPAKSKRSDVGGLSRTIYGAISSCLACQSMLEFAD